MSVKIGVLGIDHGHIFGMLSNMKRHGCSCDAYWTNGQAVTEAKFNSVFPEVSKVADKTKILEDPSIDLILISAVPADRSELAIAAMEAGKDVMVDKPGCTTREQLDRIRETVARTGRIWSVNFSERFQVPAVAKAEELVFEGAIGRVVQTVGLGPHKQNLKTRPDWFFNRERYGGILCDIGSHQIDQFLWFTGSKTASIRHALVENSTMPEHPGFQDFGEVVLQSGSAHGYVRVDWFTPNGLPTWGDGRLFIQGTDGFIELRKYTDVGREHLTDTLIMVNNEGSSMINCADGPLPYFPRLIADIRERTETAAPQSHTFTVMELALKAQEMAENEDA